MRWVWLKKIVFAANIAIMATVFFASATLPTGPFVAVVLAPWSAREQVASVVAAAGGSLVAPARVGWIVIAHSRKDGFVSRLRRAGAWLVLNHNVLSGCFRGQ